MLVNTSTSLSKYLLAISRHVLRRLEPLIAQENKNNKRKGKKRPGKVIFFLLRVKKYLAL